MSRTENVRAKRALLSPQAQAELERRLRGSDENGAQHTDALEMAHSGSDLAWPKIQADAAHRYEPFPLTDLQQAYWIGRTDAVELGNIACHVYHEIDMVGLDLERFERAWQRLIARHDM